MIDLPISKSFFATAALARLVEAAYGLDSIQCHLISATMRDVYLINAGQRRYIFYVYRGQLTQGQLTKDLCTTISPKQAESPLVLIIDVGSSSVRALLFDARARTVDGVAAQERYSVSSSDDGASEIDPDAAFERVLRCVDTALEQAGPLASAIGAVAFDTLATSIMAIDGEGRPLTPLITYADTRAPPTPRSCAGG